MRDYFDRWLLSPHPQLNKTTLQTAIERTFRNRKMEKRQRLSDSRRNSATIRTRRLFKRSGITQAPESLTDRVEELRTFNEAIFGTLAQKSEVWWILLGMLFPEFCAV